MLAHAEQSDSAERMLLDALAHERKERSCIYAAKGVLCDSARTGAAIGCLVSGACW
jgi:hypothetical protein